MDELLVRLKELAIKEKSDGRIRIDINKVYEYPEVINNISDRLLEAFDYDVNCILGFGSGGGKLAGIIGSRNPDYRIAFITKKLKNDRMNYDFDGYIPKKDDNVAIVDDLLIMGSNIRISSQVLEKTAAHILGYHFVIDKEEIPVALKKVESLFRLSQFL
jgi:orotate phosphoribosyltransferase